MVNNYNLICNCVFSKLLMPFIASKKKVTQRIRTTKTSTVSTMNFMCVKLVNLLCVVFSNAWNVFLMPGSATATAATVVSFEISQKKNIVRHALCLLLCATLVCALFSISATVKPCAECMLVQVIIACALFFPSNWRTYNAKSHQVFGHFFRLVRRRQKAVQQTSIFFCYSHRPKNTHN